MSHTLTPADEHQIPYHRYLWMPREAHTPERTESFLTDWAASGYLVLGVTEDVAPGGDPHFLQTRRPPGPLVRADEYWLRHAAMHERLRRSNLLHLPIGLGPDADSPLAQAWLVPAPARGALRVGATYQQQIELSAEERTSWLAWLAQLLSRGSTGTGQRVLVQAPGADAPAHWHYGAYAGDVPVPGATCSERVRTLLAALPRYPCNAIWPGQAPDPIEAATWPFLFNEGISRDIEFQHRVNENRELLASDQQRPGQTRLKDDWW